MPGIALILNPYAGGNKTDRTRAQRLSKILADHGTVHTPGSLDELDATIAHALDTEPDVIALCGGDGSYFRAFTILDRRLGESAWPLVLPLPAGTINNLTHAIRSHRMTPESLLAEVVADRVRGIAHEVADCDLFSVTDRAKHGPGEPAIGYIFGAGMIVNFLRAYYAARPDPGRVSAAWLIVRLMASAVTRGGLQAKIFQPFEADVVCDGLRVPHRSYRMLIASSVGAIGLGFKPFYLAGRKPGQFHVLGGPARATRLVRRLPRFYRGYPANDASLYDNIGAELEVEFARPSYYTVNGDLLGPVMRLRIERLRRITVIRG
jgi:diacylglycerol kinase family enzyme